MIWFRILVSCDFGGCCSCSELTDREILDGVRNPGFEDNENRVNTLRVPEALRQAMESPPSYEEALKYDRFGFQLPVTPISASLPSFSSSSPSSSPASARSDVPNNQQSAHASTGARPIQVSHSPPRHPDTRSRSSTAGSSSLLTPIREEEDDDDPPITVVIDCIGVQASKLIENCDTKLNLSEGEQLNRHSKC